MAQTLRLIPRRDSIKLPAQKNDALNFMIEPAHFKPRILVAIASYGTKNDQYLLRLIREYSAMPFDVDILVLSNIPKELPSKVEILVGLPTKDPWSLPFGHKQIFADRLNDYDLFIYSEDDTLITEENIRAFQEVSNTLAENEIAGLLRFEIRPDGRKSYCDVLGNFHWDPYSVRSRGTHTFAFFTNEHAACYILTRKHLQRAIDSGRFLVGPHRENYDLLCTAATDPYTQCGFEKLICISNLDRFLVHHLPNKYIGKYGVDEAAFQKQIDVLMAIGRNESKPRSLFATDTKRTSSWASKNYYEPLREDVISLIPAGVRSILSIGTGSGEIEAFLAKKGLRVMAVPLDSVISASVPNSGVEMITGELDSTFQRLAGERFDCALCLNVLHFAKQPIDMLSSITKILSEDAVVILLLPNHMQLRILWKRFRRDPGFANLGNFEKTGMHFTSRGTVKEWLKSAGLEVDRIADVTSDRAQSMSRVTFGIANALLSSEFIVIGKKA